MKTMVKRFGTMAALILMLAAPAFAGEKEGETLSKYIKTQLSFPAKLKSQKLDEKVRVDFRVKEDGTFEVVRIYTRNTELKAHLQEQFGRMQLSMQNADTKIVYRVEVNYKVL